MSIYVGMDNPLGYWLWIPFSTRFWITVRGLSSIWRIVFRISLRGVSGLWVTLGSVVPEHPLLVPVHRSFEFSIYYFVSFKYLDLIVLWCHIGRCFVT